VQTHESKGEAWSRQYATCRPSPRRIRRVIVVQKTAPPKHLESLDCLSRVGTVVLTLLLTLFSRMGCSVQSKLSDCRHTGACRARRLYLFSAQGQPWSARFSAIAETVGQRPAACVCHLSAGFASSLLFTPRINFQLLVTSLLRPRPANSDQPSLHPCNLILNSMHWCKV
jgi:hypothetical protein